MAEIEAFVMHLAIAGRVAASMQNQAKSGLLFLHKEVLHVDLPWLDNITQAKTPQRLPVVLTPSETKRVLVQLEGTRCLMASLLHDDHDLYPRLESRGQRCAQSLDAL